MSSDILDKTKKALRAVLISAPRGVPARMLCRDFKCVMGDELPYRELGFYKMEDFLNTIPDVARLGTGATGEPTYFGVADAKTSQIMRFVATQKKPKIKKSGAPPSIQKTSSTFAFTKKSRFGPMSKQPRAYYAGARSKPTGSYGAAPIRARRPSNSPYIPPARARQQQQQQQQQPANRNTNPYIGNIVNARSNSVGSAANSPANTGGGYGSRSSTSGGFGITSLGGPRTSGTSTVASHTSGTPRTSGVTAAGYARQAGMPPEYRNQVSNNRNQTSDLRNLLSGVSGASGSSTSCAGKQEFRSRQYDSKKFNAKYVDIAEINNSVKAQRYLTPYLCTEGYIAAEMRKDKKGIKYLLYNSYNKTTRGVFPALLLNFAQDNWDIENDSVDLRHIPVGSKLRVEGILFSTISKKQGLEPGLKVVYYSYESTGGSGPTRNIGSGDGASPASKTSTRNIGSGDGASPASKTSTRNMGSGDGASPASKTSTRNIGSGDGASPASKTSTRNMGSGDGASPASKTSTRNMGSWDGASPASKTPTTSNPSTSTLAPFSGDFPTLIYELLKVKPMGVWWKRFGKEFETFHKMAPPTDVSARAADLPFVEKSVVADSDNPILQLRDGVPPPSVGGANSSVGAESSDELEVFSEDETRRASEDFSSPFTSFTTSKPPLPSVVELKSEEYFDVYVSHINSPTSFYVQNVGGDNAKKLASLTADMRQHLSMNQIKPMRQVCENELYGYRWAEEDEEEESWCRVLVSSLYSSPNHTPSSSTGASRGGASKRPVNMAAVYFPDYGNTIDVSVDELLELPREFYQLPFQAVHCLLHGCEGASSDKATLVFMESALDKTCVAQVMNSSGTRVSVELINEESGGSEGSTINSQVMYALHPISSLKPRLPKCGEPRVAITLSDVDEEGVLTVQVHGPGLSRLQELMTFINNKFQKKAKAADFIPKDRVKEGEVYCGQYSVDGKFYRVKVKKVTSQDLLVEFVDYGNEAMTDIKKLRNPHQNELFNLPFQAVHCRLDGLPAGNKWSTKAHYWMASYLEHENLHLAVVEEGSEESLPLVRITAINDDEEEEEEVLNDSILIFNAEEDVSDSSESLSSNLSKLSINDSTQPASNVVVGDSASQSSSEVFVFEGKAELSPAARRTANSAPVTPRIPTSDSSFSEAESRTPPKSATDVPYDFNKALLGESGAPFQFNFKITSSPVGDNTVASVEDSVILGSKRAAQPNLMASSPKIGPKIKASPDAQELSGLNGSAGISNGCLTPASRLSTSDHLTHNESTSSSHATPSSVLSSLSADVSEASKSKSVTISTPPSLISSPRSSPPTSCSASASEAFSLGYTPDSVVEEDKRGLETSSGISEVDREAVAKAKNLLQFEVLSTEKSSVLVVVTWVTSPHHFVVQQISTVEFLNSLEAKLNEVDLLSSLSCPAKLRVGGLCLACSSLDGRFYRAIVLSHQNNEVTVEFLDYGNTEVVGVSKLKSFPPDGCDVPFQGIVCSLKGIEAVGERWSQEELEWFEEQVMDKSFFAVELNKEGGRSFVALLDTSGSATLDITQVMKAAFHSK